MSLPAIHAERIDAPDGVSSAEAQTWCRLRWPLGDDSATRTRSSVGEHEDIAVPLVSIATWILENWWSLLYELSPAADSMPPPNAAALDSAQQGWRARHDVRVADSSLLLPSLRLFSNGSGISWRLRGDTGAWPGQPPALRFIDSSSVESSRAEAIRTLGQLVGRTLEWLTACDAQVAIDLREAWAFIDRTPINSAQAEFCRAAGRLGLDPHDVDLWPDGVCTWMEGHPSGYLDRALSTDLLSFGGSPGELSVIDKALSKLIHDRGLGAAPSNSKSAGAGGKISPADPAYAVGYERAQKLRRDAKAAANGNRIDLARILFDAYGNVLNTDGAAELQGPIAAVTGWSNNVASVIVPKRAAPHPRGCRFALARGVHHALWGCEEGPRLVTDAHDVDQQASRAFAAELLAPRHAVRAHVNENRKIMPFNDAMHQTAQMYDVDLLVVQQQYDNAAAGR